MYKASEGQNAWAVRCFLRPISDHAERYAAISKHLSRNRSAHSTEFVYLADGLRIKGGTFPIVKMAWVQGQHLDRCVEGLLDKPRELIRVVRDAVPDDVGHDDGEVLDHVAQAVLVAPQGHPAAVEQGLAVRLGEQGDRVDARPTGLLSANYAGRVLSVPSTEVQRLLDQTR